jgi:hypothetical protein
MSENRRVLKKRTSLAVVGTAITAATLGAASMLPASAVGHDGPAPAAGFSVRTYPAVGTESHPDDITRLGDRVYVSFQNGVGPLGEPAPSGATASTVQQYRLDGTPGESWQVPGKVDGLTADSAHHRLLLTTNEDGNSGFSTLTPGAPQPLRTYAYTGLTHGGGTDAISVVRGKIVVSASNPADTTRPAAYTVNLIGTSARLTPIIADTSVATAVNGPHAGQSAPLALTDPDSNTVVPAGSPRFAGDLMLDAQGDQQLIFAHDAGTRRQTLNVLSVSAPLDDTAFATQDATTLWVTDPTHNVVDSVTGPFTAGQAISAVTPDTGPTYLAALNLTDGSLTPIKELATIEPKGLLFTGTRDQDSRHEAQQNDSTRSTDQQR